MTVSPLIYNGFRFPVMLKERKRAMLVQSGAQIEEYIQLMSSEYKQNLIVDVQRFHSS
jgi:hypothetical protein